MLDISVPHTLQLKPGQFFALRINGEDYELRNINGNIVLVHKHDIPSRDHDRRIVDLRVPLEPILTLLKARTSIDSDRISSSSAIPRMSTIHR